MTRTFLHPSAPVIVNEQHSMDAARRLGLSRLKTELGLTPAQESIVTTALDEYGKYYQNIEDEREDVALHGKQKILECLDDQQKKRFAKLFGNATQP